MHWRNGTTHSSSRRDHERRRRLGAGLLALAGLLAAPAIAAADTPISMCVPSAAGAAITTPKSGTTCNAGSTYKQSASQADYAATKAALTAATTRIAALEAKLAGVTRDTVNGKNTLTFRSQNVRIVNGGGSSPVLNGLGNLIIGYNETPGTQTGSHNLLMGRDQQFTSWGSVIAGANNTSSAPLQVLFGQRNTATTAYGTVTGGYGNTSDERYATVSGGCGNIAGWNTERVIPEAIRKACTFDDGGGDPDAPTNFPTAQTVSGGAFNRASGPEASISGGVDNRATGEMAAVSGGGHNSAADLYASVSGGESNSAYGPGSSVTGGTENGAGWGEVPFEFPPRYVGGNTVAGGHDNVAEGVNNAILGGEGIRFDRGGPTAWGDRNQTYPAGP